MTIRHIITLFCVVCFASLYPLDFNWQIEGAAESYLIEAIKKDALIARKEEGVTSLSVLCQLADNQTDLWLQEMQSRAYFNAKIDWTLDPEASPVMLTFYLDPGPIYPLEAVEIEWTDCEHFDLSPADIGLVLNEPALPSLIFDAEENFLQTMALKGYPLAKIVSRDVFADQQACSVRVVFNVEAGQQVRFGQTRITGNTTVKEEYIAKKIAWKEGKVFNSDKIERTQEELEATGLFSAVTVQAVGDLDESGGIPLEVLLTEAKHRTIGGGIGYSTQQGVGLSGEWQHRNFRGMGERLDIQTKIWTDVQTGQIEYMIPGFRHTNQDLRFILEGDHEKTKGYTETSFSLSAMLDKRINDLTFLSYGASYKNLRTTHSDNDGTFNLLKLPVVLRWSNANDSLDPTNGMSFNFKSVPSFQIGHHSFGYWVNSATGTFYMPLTEDESVVFASKLTAGTILGASKKEIPPSERFYSGTENTLRGYRFMSVSPLNHQHKPTGGRSMLILSSEARWKVTSKIGVAAFYEIGNVYANPLPDFSQGQLQSAGAGIRYDTGVGPVRLDVAFPLNPRPHVDPPFQIYMSIGQAF